MGVLSGPLAPPSSRSFPECTIHLFLATMQKRYSWRWGRAGGPGGFPPEAVWVKCTEQEVVLLVGRWSWRKAPLAWQRLKRAARVPPLASKKDAPGSAPHANDLVEHEGASVCDVRHSEERALTASLPWRSIAVGLWVV